MEGFVAYILFSKRYNKYYYGHTSNLIARFKDHNELGNKGWVRKFRPWEVIHLEFFATRPEALKREKFFKSGAGRDWIRKNIDHLK